MRWRHWKLVAVVLLLAVMLSAVGYAKKTKAKDKPRSTAKAGETERKVTAADVSKAALATLKKMARGAKITEFAEEIEHGSTFYEGSWKGRSGANVDVLVTDAGALVEIEERIATDKVPAAVLKAARKAAGKNAELACERKTMILYEIKFRKGDGLHELLLTPDGRRIEEEVEKGKSDDEDKGRGRKHKDDADDEDDKKGKAKKHKSKKNDDGDDDDDDEDADDEDADEEDDDKKVSIKDVPKRVKATIVKQVKGGRIEGIERIKADGKGVYEADIIVKGKEIELIVAPNGKLLSRKVEGDAKGDDDDDEDEDADDDDEDEDADDDDEDDDEDDK